MRYKNTLCLLFSLCLFSLWGCASEDDPYTPKPPRAMPPKQQQYGYNIYIENSGSLNGYLKASGEGSLKNDMYKLITDIYGLPGKSALSLYDINTVTIPVAADVDAAQLDAYLRNLNAATFKDRSAAYKGNQSQSDLRDVIKAVLDTTGMQEVSLLITDGIFSPGKKKDAFEFLNEQQNGIKGFVIDKLKRDSLSTLVLQFTSGFSGTYYNQDNSPRKGFFSDRPYYVICFGKEEALLQLLQHVQNQPAFKGYRQFLFLTGRKAYDVKPRIRPYTDYYEYNADEPMTVSHMSKGGRDNRSRIKISVDLSSLPADKAYLENKEHYTVNSGYSIESILPSRQKGSTHEIILTAPNPQTGVLTLSLKRQMPGWVIESSLEEDKSLSDDALEGKTFGLSFLLGGIYEAYGLHTSQSEYYTISIHVKE